MSCLNFSLCFYVTGRLTEGNVNLLISIQGKKQYFRDRNVLANSFNIEAKGHQRATLPSIGLCRMACLLEHDWESRLVTNIFEQKLQDHQTHTYFHFNFS